MKEGSIATWQTTLSATLQTVVGGGHSGLTSTQSSKHRISRGFKPDRRPGWKPRLYESQLDDNYLKTIFACNKWSIKKLKTFLQWFNKFLFVITVFFNRSDCNINVYFLYFYFNDKGNMIQEFSHFGVEGMLAKPKVIG